MNFLKIVVLWSLFWVVSNPADLMTQDIHSKSSGSDIDVADNYFMKAKKFYEKAQYDSSMVYFELAGGRYAKMAAQTKQDTTWAKYVDCLRYVGSSWLGKGVMDTALAIANKALQIGIDKLGEKHATIASVLNTRAEIHRKNTAYEDARLDFTRALAIGKEVLGENHKVVADSYNGIGLIHMSQGELNTAMEYLNKSLQIRLMLFGRLNIDVAGSYNNLGLIHDSLTEYDKALEYYQKALETKIQILGENSSSVASTYNNMAAVHVHKGDYENALKYYSYALDIFKNQTGKMLANAAAVYDNMGALYEEKGDLDKALEFEHQALAIRLSILDPNHNEISTNYNNLGVTYFKKKDYLSSLEFYKKALAINLTRFGEMHVRVADNYMNIGLTYSALKDYQTALDYEKKALTIYQNKLGPEHRKVGQNFENIGVIYKYMGDYEKELDSYRQAASISEKSLGKHHPLVAAIYDRIGQLYSRWNKPDSSIHYFQKSMASLVPSIDANSITQNPKQSELILRSSLLNALTGKASELQKRYHSKSKRIQDLEMSLSTYELSVALIEKFRHSIKAEESQLFFGEETFETYHGAISTAFDMFKASADVRYKYKAFEFLERGKSSVLWYSISEINAQRFAGISDSLIQKEKDMRSDLIEYETQVQREKQKKQNLDSAKLADLESRFFTLNRQYEDLVAEFETKYPKYYDLKYQTRTASVKEVQQVLDTKTALVEYAVGDTSLFIFVISKQAYNVVSVAIDSTLDQTIKQFYASIKKLKKEPFLESSATLYSKLIAPIQDHIVNQEKLVIIPSGRLHYIPFEALVPQKAVVADKSGKIAQPNFAKLDYLIRRFEISYHYSATLFAKHAKQQPTTKRMTEGDFLGFAPVFSDTMNNGKILASHRSVFDTSYSDAARSVSVDGVKLGEIKFTEKEIESILELFKANKRRGFGYFHKAASEENFKTQAGQYKYVHIATHGLLNEAQPKLSALVFSQPTDSSVTEDGVLYAAETYNLNLNADLVVLSSCETGIGKLVKGEGLMALTRGFLYAGTPNIVFSLWKVSDQYTKDLMIEFYRHLVAGKSYSTALRQAKLAMIANEITARPAMWSAFVLVGR